MRFIIITILAVAGSLVALATAKPVPNRNAGGTRAGMAIPLNRRSSSLDSRKTIDLNALRSHSISVKEKILNGLDNYEINMGTVHPFAVKRSESRLRNRGIGAPLTAFFYRNTDIWTAEISIGTPPKTLRVRIDTGSADMWVLGAGCIGISGDRDLWNPNSSESAKKQGQPFMLRYADGSSVIGDRYIDNVTIAGFTADHQTFGSTLSFKSKLQNNGNADGLIGFAFPSVSKFGVDPLLESLVKQKKLINPTFSLKLSSPGAEIYLGGANSMLYKGDIAYTRITSSGFWQVSTDDVRVNGNPILDNVPVVFDTGASLIFGDQERVSRLYRDLGAIATPSGNESPVFYYLPCDSFPIVSFTFGGKTFQIPPEALRLQPVTESSPYCISAIVGVRWPIKFWTIGRPFLKSVYSVFDYSALQVGFAELA